jgi:hypothetical protein
MVQEVVTQSWFGRIGSALVGVLIGILLIIASFLVIFWNEGHGLHAQQSLQQAEKVLVSIQGSPVIPGNNLKVVYLSGLATTDDVLQDTLFGVSVKAIKLLRKVEMYQWKQSEETQTEKEVGGSEREVKTYTYSKVWSDELLDSSNFKDPNGHQNPSTMLVSSEAWQAQKVTLGDFALPGDLVSKITFETPINLAFVDAASLNKKLQKPVEHDDGIIYVGSDPQTPAIGDLRISLSSVVPQTVSVIAQQNGNTFQPYMAPAGQAVELLVSGQVSPQQMIHQAEVENQMQTWLIRLVTLLMMIFGVMLTLKPVSVLADVIPFFGSIVGFGTGLIALLSGLCLWTAATAIAWISVRPFMAIVLILAAAIICMLLWSRRMHQTAG